MILLQYAFVTSNVPSEPYGYQTRHFSVLNILKCDLFICPVASIYLQYGCCWMVFRDSFRQNLYQLKSRYNNLNLCEAFGPHYIVHMATIWKNNTEMHQQFTNIPDFQVFLVVFVGLALLLLAILLSFVNFFLSKYASSFNMVICGPF